MTGVFTKFLWNGGSLQTLMLVIVSSVILKLSHDGMEINHMDFLVPMVLFLGGFL